MPYILKAATPNDMLAAAKEIIVNFPEAKIFAFYGAMGAGKTTFIKSFCNVLNAETSAQSPSFAIVHEYRTKDHTPIYHFDFYRTRDIKEIYDIGYEDYFYSGSYCFIEWPEKAEQLLPPGHVRIDIAIGKNDERIISIS